MLAKHYFRSAELNVSKYIFNDKQKKSPEFFILSLKHKELEIIYFLVPHRGHQ